VSKLLETSEKMKYYARLSFLRKQESSSGATLWIPAFAGMTYREYFSDVSRIIENIECFWRYFRIFIHLFIPVLLFHNLFDTY